MANFQAKDASGATITKAAVDTGAGVLADQVNVVDATAAHTMPTMDAAARTGFVQISNGTIQLGVFAEDAASSSGDKGLMILAVREATATDLSAGNTDGDFEPLQVDASGRLWAHVGAIDAIAAGETHLGEIAEPRTVLSVTPTIDTNIFAAGDAVGGKQTLTSAARVSGGLVTLETLTVVDKGNQKAALTILFFDSDPTAATITNNAAFVFSTAVSKLVGKINVAAADYITIDSTGIASYQLKDLGLMLKASGSANLFVAVVLTSGTPTYLSTTDLIFKYGFKQS